LKKKSECDIIYRKDLFIMAIWRKKCVWENFDGKLKDIVDIDGKAKKCG
jgi:hypothetical protein